MSGDNICKGEKKERKSDVDEHITRYYELKRRLGKGAYGIVWKATDRRTNETVAVKKIFEAFRNQTDAQRTFREIMFLLAFREHPNIIRLRGLHKATNHKDIYLVFDYMETDLHHVIKKGTVLKDLHKRYIMYQLFRATSYLHSGNVIHRDQKPSNILINAECKIKIADFGLARSLAHANTTAIEDEDGILTDYVATRWYRAPEILVASKKYTKGVDMWSLGCILGEMLLGKPLFPGSSTVNQMERIMAVLPEPTQEEINNMCSGYGKGLLEGAAGPRSSIKALAKTPNGEALDLLTKLLVFDPNKRLKAIDALKHPFVNNFRSGREPILKDDVTPPLDDDTQLTVSEYRDKLYEMMGASSERRHKHEYPLEKIPNDKMFYYKGKQKQYIDYTQRMGQGDFKEIDETKRNRQRTLKNQSMEDFRVRSVTNGMSNLGKSESIHQGNGSLKKVGSSPPHRPNVPHHSFGWSDRQRLLCGVKAAIPKKTRCDEGGGGDYYKKVPISHGHQPYKATMSQTHSSPGQSSTLPKVSNASIQSQTSPQQAKRYQLKQGALTKSALEEIRSVLKKH